MHVILTIPIFHHRSHYGTSIGQFCMEHERQGNLIFDLGKGNRRFVPRAMCILEEYTDDEWQRMEKERAEQEEAEAGKAAAEKTAADKKVEDERRAAQAIKDAKFINRVKRFLRLR